MAFPTAGILDNFNRADGAIGSNWTIFFEDGFRVVSNTCALTTGGLGEGGTFWNVTTNFTDTEVYTTLSTTGNLALYARANSDASNGYLLSFESGNLVLYGTTGGVTLATYPTVGLANGDAFGCAVIGTNIETFKRVSGVWSSLGSVTDTSVSSGRVGMYTGNTTVRFDDFGGGAPVVAGSTGAGRMKANNGVWGNV